MNKQDQGLQDEEHVLISGNVPSANVMSISAHEGTGLDAFESRLEQFMADVNVQSTSVILTLRPAPQRWQLFTTFRPNLDLSAADQTELVAEEFRAATMALSRILGQIDVEDVLDHIFSSFLYW